MNTRFWIEIGISALIAFGATFFGVYLGFSKERRRAAAEETEQFGQILNGVLNESAPRTSWREFSDRSLWSTGFLWAEISGGASRRSRRRSKKVAKTHLA